MQETFLSLWMRSLFLRMLSDNFFCVCVRWRHTIDSRPLLTMVWCGMGRHRWRMVCGFFWTLCQKKIIITFLRFSVICSFSILYSAFWLHPFGWVFLHILFVIRWFIFGHVKLQVCVRMSGSSKIIIVTEEQQTRNIYHRSQEENLALFEYKIHIQMISSWVLEVHEFNTFWISSVSILTRELNSFE